MILPYLYFQWPHSQAHRIWPLFHQNHRHCLYTGKHHQPQRYVDRSVLPDLNTHKPDVVDCGLKDWHKVLTRSALALSGGGGGGRKKTINNNSCCRQICASRETIWQPTESAFFLHLLPNSDLRQWCDNNISAENYMRTSDTKMTTEQR